MNLLSRIVAFLTAAFAWLKRQRLARYLQWKETMFTITIIASIVLLALLAVLPDLIAVLSTLQLMPPLVKTALVLVAAVPLIVVGCSKQNEPAKPIRWTAPETGYRGETPPEPKQEAP